MFHKPIDEMFPNPPAGLDAHALREDAVPLSGAGELCGAVAVGNEGHGLSGEMLDLCDKLVVIPMKGQTESLSAPCAAAILLWELWGRRDAGC